MAIRWPRTRYTRIIIRAPMESLVAWRTASAPKARPRVPATEAGAPETAISWASPPHPMTPESDGAQLAPRRSSRTESPSSSSPEKNDTQPASTELGSAMKRV